MDIRGKNGQKTEHFTGIGVNNVDNRIKMIYGMDYGINIVSQENEGNEDHHLIAFERVKSRRSFVWKTHMYCS